MEKDEGQFSKIDLDVIAYNLYAINLLYYTLDPNEFNIFCSYKVPNKFRTSL